ncbi:MAG: PEP-CTERM sorting domain-containing protein [Isosphaeraceae bacterium]|nr:PEP-CTERM sorting domain-containing protein [Isosphaeraceae bacterium]
MSRSIKFPALLLLIAPCLSETAVAVVVRSFEFNVPGVLPSSEPDISFFNNGGAPETTLYSVSGGLLKQRTFGLTGNFSYLYPNFLENGDFDPSQSLVMETRLRVHRIAGTSPGQAYFQVFDSLFQFGLYFAENALLVPTSTGFFSYGLDLTVMRTYRLESPGNSSTARIYVDGRLVGTVTAPNARINHFGFGDGLTPGGGADVDWDYIRINTATAVPEPSTFAAAGLGLVAAVATARRRRRAV